MLELEITDLAFGARGVAREGDFVWFVDGALPGQRIRAKIRRIRKHYGEAMLIEVVRPAPDQVDPPCPHFGLCGGCQLQHWAYPSQVAAKTRQITEILKRIGGQADPPVRPTRPAGAIYGYRNKTEFTFSRRRWLLPDDPFEMPSDFALGFHVPGRFDKVLDIRCCLLQSDQANRILNQIKTLALESGLPPYDQKNHTGFWRFLILREGRATGETLVWLITTPIREEAEREAVFRLAETLHRAFPAITTFVHGESDAPAEVARSRADRILWGPGKIHEEVSGRRFEIAPDAFFQTNTQQAEALFETIAALGDFRGDEILYDLYCGTGAIGLVLADRVRRVVGVEVVPSAVENARRNAVLNGIENATFVLADMQEALHEASFIHTDGPPDVVVLDPPRGGMHPKTIQDLLALGAPRLLYVSCNPPLLARDCVTLGSRYRLEVVQPVDLFPHTKHLEAVALLRRHS